MVDQHGVLYYPGDDPRTGFYVIAQDLSHGLDAPITETDLPDLQEGVWDGLQSLPEFEIISKAGLAKESAIGFEFFFTFALDDAPCQRRMRLLYRDRQQFTIYGGIYTVVFIGLAILTFIEVAAGSIKASWTIPLLLVLALAKAALVVLYYMHLRTDSRIFSLVLLVPLGMALLSVLYLLAVPPTGY